MGTAATSLSARSSLRRSWLGAAVLAVLIGTAAGAVAATLAGAHRIESSYARLAEDVDAPRGLIPCEKACTGTGSLEERLGADPAIAAVAVSSQQWVSIEDPSGRYLGTEPEADCVSGAGELDLSSGDWPRTGHPPARLVAGRFPDPASTDEVTLAEITARRSGIEVGDKVLLTIGSCGLDSHLPLSVPKPLTVVGIAVGVFDVRPPGQTQYFENVYVSPALTASTGFDTQTILAFWLQPGASLDDLSPEVRDRVFLDLEDRAAAVSDALGPDATALRVFGLAAIVAIIAIFGQLIATSVRQAAQDHGILRSLGATRPGLAAIGLARGVVVGAGAGITAALSTSVISPFIPMGAADPLERGRSTPGLPLVAAWAGLGALVGVVALSAIPAVRAARTSTRVVPARAGRMPTRAAEAMRCPPTPTLGIGFALEPSAGTSGASIRSGLSALAIALATVSGVVTFAAGLDHLNHTPRLVGRNWDVEVFEEGQDTPAIARAIAAHPDVERSAMGTIYNPGLALAPGEPGTQYVIGFDVTPNGIGPVVTEGRPPVGPDEVLVSRGLAAKLGLEIGDVTTVVARDLLASVGESVDVDASQVGAPATNTVPVEVVGIGVIPVTDGQLDLGGAMTLDGLVRAFPRPSRADVMRVLSMADPATVWDRLLEAATPAQRDELVAAGSAGVNRLLASWPDDIFEQFIPATSPQVVFVDFRDGVEPLTALRDFAAAGIISEETLAQALAAPDALTPEKLVNLDLSNAARIPASFGTLMALVALAVLAMVVVTTSRSRRRDLATLRALGLDSTKTRAVVLWQGLVTALVAAAIAIPIGVIAGRLAWGRYAGSLDVVPEPVTPWLALVAMVAVTVLAALLVAIEPAWRAARRPPIESLRSE